jgi:hypothetical protein
MAPTLVGYPSEASPSGAISPVELGEVVIDASPEQLRALGNHLLQAARELEAGVSQIEAFSFPDARPPRNTPSQVVVAGKSQRG